MVYVSSFKQVIFCKYGKNLKNYDNPELPKDFRYAPIII